MTSGTSAVTYRPVLLARPARTVADAMLTDVKISRPDVTVGDVRALFADEHVHAAVIVDDGGVLLAVVDRADLEPRHRDDRPAVRVGRRQARTVAPDDDLDDARQRMLIVRRRRLAVDAGGRLLGLLCLKRSWRGFCSDHDVRRRSVGPRSS